MPQPIGPAGGQQDTQRTPTPLKSVIITGLHAGDGLGALDTGGEVAGGVIVGVGVGVTAGEVFGGVCVLVGDVGGVTTIEDVGVIVIVGVGDGSGVSVGVGDGAIVGVGVSVQALVLVGVGVKRAVLV